MLRPSAPPAVRWITRTLEEAGHDTWAVGGAVRDALLGRPSGDWDLTTRARPDELQELFRRTVPIGIEHGTVGVLVRDGKGFEFICRTGAGWEGKRRGMRDADAGWEEIAAGHDANGPAGGAV